MKIFCCVLVLSLFSVSLFAQRGNPEQKEAIKKLGWLIGEWRGRSTVEADGKKRITNIKESVQPALDGTLLLINVRATDKDTGTRLQSLAYTSFSVISFDLKNREYRWTTWRNNGNSYNQSSFTVGDQSFEYITKEDRATVRYKGSLGNGGEFLETGEYKQDSNWQPFISMKLIKSGR